MVDFVAFENTLDLCSKQIKGWEDVIQIGYFPTVDALIASSIIAQALHNLEKPFVIFRCSNYLEEIQKRGKERPYIFLGGSFTEDISSEFTILWISEPSETKSEQNGIINASDFGLAYVTINPPEDENVAEITISLIAREISLRLEPSLEYNLLPLVAEQSIRIMTETSGLHRQLAEWAESENLVTQKDALRVFGAELFGIVETIETSYEPFFPKLTNNSENIKKFLKNIKRKGQRDGINLEKGNQLRRFSELTKDELIDLNKSLFMYLTQNTGYRENRVNYFSKKVMLLSEEHYPILSNTWDFARAIKDAMNKNNDILALSVLLGNRGDYYDSLTRLFGSQRSVLNSLFSFFKPEDVEELKNIRTFAPGERVDWFNAANVAVMLLSSGMTTIDRPLAVIVPGPDEFETIAIRASSNLELGHGLGEIALEIIQENGGVYLQGDQFSSQIHISSDRAEDFVQKLNQKLGETN